MTKKDYELIAGIFKNHAEFVHNETALSMLYSLVQGLCKEFEKENPRFDKEKFYKACGLVSFDSSNQ